MYLTRQTITAWADARRERGETGAVLVKLDSDDWMDRDIHRDSRPIHGPGIVELTVFQDDVWTARPMTFETPETIDWSTL